MSASVRRSPNEDGLQNQFEDNPVSTTGINPGELYWAARNAGSIILTCKEYQPEKDIIVMPEESSAYPYNDYECYKQKS